MIRVGAHHRLRTQNAERSAAVASGGDAGGGQLQLCVQLAEHVTGGVAIIAGRTHDAGSPTVRLNLAPEVAQLATAGGVVGIRTRHRSEQSGITSTDS